MVQADVLRAKTERILHHCERLRARGGLTAEQLVDDEDLRNIVLMDVQQAIQACIDLATHACTDARLGVPASAAEAFATLARERVIDAELASRLGAASGLRNLIVHQYADIELERLLTGLREDLADLPAFARALRRDV